jgi:hypothetical protein
MNKKRVVIVEPNKDPYVQLVENTFFAMREIVDGPMNLIYLGQEYYLIHNKENLTLDYNRGLYGTFFITKGLHEEKEHIEGLTEQEAQLVTHYLNDFNERRITINMMLPLLNEEKERIGT